MEKEFALHFVQSMDFVENPTDIKQMEKIVEDVLVNTISIISPSFLFNYEFYDFPSLFVRTQIF